MVANIYGPSTLFELNSIKTFDTSKHGKLVDECPWKAINRPSMLNLQSQLSCVPDMRSDLFTINTLFIVHSFH